MEQRYHDHLYECFCNLLECNKLDFFKSVASKSFDADSSCHCVMCYTVSYLIRTFKDILRNQDEGRKLRKSIRLRRYEAPFNTYFHNAEGQLGFMKSLHTELKLFCSLRSLPVCYSCRDVSISKMFTAHLVSPMLNKLDINSLTKEQLRRVFRSHLRRSAVLSNLQRYFRQIQYSDDPEKESKGQMAVLASEYKSVYDDDALIKYLTNCQKAVELPDMALKVLNSWEDFHAAKLAVSYSIRDRVTYESSTKVIEFFRFAYYVTCMIFPLSVTEKRVITKDESCAEIMDGECLNFPCYPSSAHRHCLLFLRRNPIPDDYECIVCRIKGMWIRNQHNHVVQVSKLLSTNEDKYHHAGYVISSRQTFLDDYNNFLRVCELLLKKYIRILKVLYPDLECMKCLADDESLSFLSYEAIMCPVSYLHGFTQVQSVTNFLAPRN